MALPSLCPPPEKILAECAAIRQTPEWEPHLGGERMLLIGVLEHAFHTLEDWCHRKAGRLLEHALNAHRWLMSDDLPERGSRKFTFAEICDHLGLEISSTRSALYEQLDQERIAELSLTLLRRTAADRAHVADSVRVRNVSAVPA